MEIPWQNVEDENYIQNVLESHLGKNGSKFWIKEAEKIAPIEGGIEKVIEDIEGSKEKLYEILGLQKKERKERFIEALRKRPYEHLVPKDALSEVHMLGESGGTMGLPKRAVVTETDRDRNYEKVNYIMDELGFLEGGDWLYVGPPHPPHFVGDAARGLASQRDGNLYGVDLDPRIMKKFGKEGMKEALGRYKKHIGEQMQPILKNNDVDVLFTTSKILETLPKQVDDVSKLGLNGILHGGTNLDQETNRVFQEEVYERIPFTGVLGSGFTGGHAIQLPTENHEVTYLPLQPDLNTEVIDEDGAIANYGERGRITNSKYTEHFLMPNFEEEMTGVLTESPKYLEDVDWPCVKNLEPIEERSRQNKGGVY